MLSRKTSYLLLFPVFVILIGYVVWPFLRTIETGLQGDAWHAVFKSEDSPNIRALLQSVVLGLLSVVGAGVLGTGLAWLFYRFDFPLRRLLQAMAALPLALPPLVGVMAFLYLYGPSGMLPRSLQVLFGWEEVPFSFEGFPAVWLVHVYTQFVYFYLFVSAALRNMDGSLLEAASDLGAGEGRMFFKVVLPILRPALVGAGLLVFMVSMASFTAPLLFDGSGRYLTLQIFNYKTNGERELAAVVSTALTLICLVLLVVAEWKPEIASRQRAKGTASPTRPITQPWKRGLALGVALLILLFLGLPVLTIVLLSFAVEGSWTTQILPSAYTFSHYRMLFNDPSFAEPIRNSLQMAALATLGNLIFGITASLLIVKSRLLGRTLLRVMTALPFAIPGTVIALNLILSFSTPSALSFGQILVGSYAILPLAYFIRHIPLVVRATTAALENYDDQLTEAAYDLGASTWRTFRTVMFPILLPAIVAGTLLSFVTALGEFVSSIMLYIIDNRPISVEILAQLRQYNFGGAAAYSVLLMVLIGASTLATQWIGRVGSKKSNI
ncbi:MAG TPA: iron ABC transporter permease [Rhodothermales bacterium]|nr:iron ABC transporter permease [Rhodothermales bacterium]